MRRLFTLAIVSAGLVYGQAQITRTVRLANIGSPQGIQEALTVLRTVANIRSVVSGDNANSSITFTGTPTEVALGGWIIASIDVGGPMAPQQYVVPGAKDDVVKVAYLTNTNMQQGIQELLTQLRMVLSLAKVFDVTRPQAVVFRGTSDQIAATTWLIAQLDRPFDPNAATATYPIGADQVKVFYLHNISGPKPTQELLNAIRMQAKVQHVFVNHAPRAIAMLGTTDRIAEADALVAMHDVPTTR